MQPTSLSGGCLRRVTERGRHFWRTRSGAPAATLVGSGRVHYLIPSMETHSTTPKSTATDPPVERLTRLQFWAIVTLGVAIFLVGTGPVWRHPWSMDAFNAAVLYSYLPLPVLVAIGLWVKRRLGLKAFFLDTLEVLVLKYALTFGFALVVWSIVPAPPPAAALGARPVQARSAVPVEPAPPPTPIPEDQRGRVEGVVVAGTGAPVEGALVFVAAGLERYVFAAPERPLEIENDGNGIRPPVAAAVFGQPIFARSADGHLHTLVATKDDATLLNVPLLRSGAPSSVVFHEAHGVMELRCRVHQRTEAPALLGVFAHPYFAITGPDGRFAWSGVPAAALRVAARRSAEAGAREAPLAPGARVDMRIELHRQ
jgi:hypothetical protein